MLNKYSDIGMFKGWQTTDAELRKGCLDWEGQGPWEA